MHHTTHNRVRLDSIKYALHNKLINYVGRSVVQVIKCTRLNNIMSYTVIIRIDL